MLRISYHYIKCVAKIKHKYLTSPGARNSEFDVITTPLVTDNTFFALHLNVLATSAHLLNAGACSVRIV